MRPTRLAGYSVKVAFVLCILAGFPSAPAEAVRIQDDPNGFNGYTWGASRASYPSLRHVKDLGSTESGERISVYEKPGEVVTLNGALLAGIRYRFVDDRLESIVLSYEGRENRDNVLRWVEEHYGKLTLPERRMLRQVEWHGDKTEVTLTFNHITKEGMLLFISLAFRERLFDSNMGGGGMP